MKNKSDPLRKVALYDPYLDTLGGGEKHILSILKALEDEGYEINIFWDKNQQDQIKNRFQLHFSNKIIWLPNIFKKQSILHSLRTLLVLKAFDYFFYVTDGSYFFSSAKKNFVFSMVPNRNLYQMTLLNKLKTFNYRFISNSIYTQSWLKRWGIASSVIYPYLDKNFLDMKTTDLRKENVILSIGRFYGHLHSKRQSVLIDLFNKLKQRSVLLKNFRLILAGGLKEEDKRYFFNLKARIKDNSAVTLKSNVGFTELLNLYSKSLIYIQMTGFGIDENKNPEQVEHLGIAPLEAMASGCLTFCYKAGGSKEIITDGENGFLFGDEDELIKKVSVVLKSESLQHKIRLQAKKFVKANFSYGIFKKRLLDVLKL